MSGDIVREWSFGEGMKIQLLKTGAFMASFEVDWEELAIEDLEEIVADLGTALGEMKTEYHKLGTVCIHCGEEHPIEEACPQEALETEDEQEPIDWGEILAQGCPVCISGIGEYMGTLGRIKHYRCRACGHEWGN